MQPVLHGIRYLIVQRARFSAISAALGVAGVVGLLMDFGAWNYWNIFYVSLLVAACLRWMSALRIDYVDRGEAWAKAIQGDERGAVVAAGLLFVLVCVLSVLAVALLATTTRQRPIDIAGLAVALAVICGLFAWIRAAYPWKVA